MTTSTCFLTPTYVLIHLHSFLLLPPNQPTSSSSWSWFMIGVFYMRACVQAEKDTSINSEQVARCVILNSLLCWLTVPTWLLRIFVTDHRLEKTLFFNVFKTTPPREVPCVFVPFLKMNRLLKEGKSLICLVA